MYQSPEEATTLSGTEHRTREQLLSGLDLFSLEKAKGHLPAACNCLLGRCEEDELYSLQSCEMKSQRNIGNKMDYEGNQTLDQGMKGLWDLQP